MKKITTLLCAAVALACIGGCSDSKDNKAQAQNSASSAPKTTVVKYSVVFGSSGTQADGANALGALIKEHSKGSLNMQFYPSGQLGDKVAAYEGLQNGTIEMTECAVTDLSAFNSMWSVFSLPYMWESGEQAIKTLTDPEVMAVLSADAEANGFKIIAWTDLGSRSFVNTKRPINTPADLKGLKIRCMEDAVLADSINAMGAIATPLPFSEVYTGMQQGTLDGADYQIPNVLAAAWQEICPYMSLSEHFTIPDVVFVSKVWFDGLSKADQEAIVKAGNDFTNKWNNESWPNAIEVSTEKLEKTGMKINEVNKEPFMQAVSPVVEKFLANATEEQKKLYELLDNTKKKY